MFDPGKHQKTLGNHQTKSFPAFLAASDVALGAGVISFITGLARA